MVGLSGCALVLGGFKLGFRANGCVYVKVYEASSHEALFCVGPVVLVDVIKAIDTLIATRELLVLYLPFGIGSNRIKHKQSRI
ncbi:hypothetical protein DPMN_189956 [Dreissena polymorpha]|uniref:Uncharacterized protein n=1 Tax=Dreissena polymorpha TaxID=45954 RepID=A0A9D4DV97_DREPO|nr:hypothetical protein DPMN_189956 [Dreissena polymorpha]